MVHTWLLLPLTLMTLALAERTPTAAVPGGRPALEARDFELHPEHLDTLHQYTAMNMALHVS